ncbi:NUDIX domain-containing protein [Nocardioides sp. MAH-18]|uniref:NUDIX domain-containing protein n=1 Tax=Nocardioides agri TaxID=2682843 RepID=A0A6L6XQZ5_9ACTN|nr:MULTISPECIES: NUDIX domain-containing protein [unclassified Nocardioides]MBA2954704.1 NUDIX domain-containing protein [Nocardioides sp. CGMCC 1.13656]MVQ49560.1 NUDIX domain-containing protein [Nocardioides sp. MAH-18]
MLTVPALEDFDYDTRLGAYAVITRDDHVLLALWNEPAVATWTLPGGGVELGESLEEGAVREVREETGYDVTLGALLGVRTLLTPPERRQRRRERWLRQVHVVYAATVVGGDLTREVDGTTDEARWVPLADVPGLVRSEQVRQFVG